MCFGFHYLYCFFSMGSMNNYIKEYSKAVDTSNKPPRLLTLLLLADLAFISIHCLVIIGVISGPSYSIEADLGFAEIYQYIKEFWIVVLLLMLAFKKQHIIYLSWSLLFIYLLLDDCFQIHEIGGSLLAAYFDFKPMFRLRPQDFGELIVSSVFGFIFLTFIGASLFMSDNMAKRVSKNLFFLLIMLSFFGVFIDMLHIAIPWATSIWGLIEDGGEMIVISVILWYSFGIETEPTQTSPQHPTA